jgi:hypothetical protein
MGAVKGVSLVLRRNLLLPVALLALGATADAGGRNDGTACPSEMT